MLLYAQLYEEICRLFFYICVSNLRSGEDEQIADAVS
jgi:hypothetical protein